MPTIQVVGTRNQDAFEVRTCKLERLIPFVALLTSLASLPFIGNDIGYLKHQISHVKQDTDVEREAVNTALNRLRTDDTALYTQTVSFILSQFDDSWVYLAPLRLAYHLSVNKTNASVLDGIYFKANTSVPSEDVLPRGSPEWNAWWNDNATQQYEAQEYHYLGISNDPSGIILECDFSDAIDESAGAIQYKKTIILGSAASFHDDRKLIKRYNTAQWINEKKNAYQSFISAFAPDLKGPNSSLSWIDWAESNVVTESCQGPRYKCIGLPLEYAIKWDTNGKRFQAWSFFKSYLATDAYFEVY
jgi:hypothetical protein